MTSTPLAELDLTDVRSAMAELRVQRVRAQVRDGTYRAPVQKVAEAIIASSLLGLPPDPRFLAWVG
ncbi:MAG TPA: flagellar biosynthesis anti-sigma factor FlgM [Acidimicrobiia bacterium]